MATPYKIVIPENSEWKCQLWADISYTPLKGKEPNWFWRKMQYLILGFKWSKQNGK